MAAGQHRRAPTGSGGVASAQLIRYLRYGLAAAGVVALLLGSIAVFTTTNGLGAFALLLGGLVLVCLAVLAPLAGTRLQVGDGQGRDREALLDLLHSADPQIRMAAAESVLEWDAQGSRASQDTREAALEVLLERDLIRRLADLLRRGGFAVESDGLRGGTGSTVADVVVQVSGSGGMQAIPIAVNSRPVSEGSHPIQRMAAVAAKFGSNAAVIVNTGPQPSDVPLGNVTPYADVQVFSVYAPRLTDEAEILSAVARAGEAAQLPSPKAVPQDAALSAADRKERSEPPRLGAKAVEAVPNP